MLKNAEERLEKARKIFDTYVMAGLLVREHVRTAEKESEVPHTRFGRNILSVHWRSFKAGFRDMKLRTVFLR